VTVTASPKESRSDCKKCYTYIAVGSNAKTNRLTVNCKVTVTLNLVLALTLALILTLTLSLTLDLVLALTLAPALTLDFDLK